jgi:hypothetical protein
MGDSKGRHDWNQPAKTAKRDDQAEQKQQMIGTVQDVVKA